MTMQLPRGTVSELVGRNVNAQLAKERWSANKAAAQLGWTQTYISRRITGKVAFDVTDLTRLSGLLKVPVSVFLAGVDKAGPWDYKAASSPVPARARLSPLEVRKRAHGRPPMRAGSSRPNLSRR